MWIFSRGEYPCFHTWYNNHEFKGEKDFSEDKTKSMGAGSNARSSTPVQVSSAAGFTPYSRCWRLGLRKKHSHRQFLESHERYSDNSCHWCFVLRVNLSIDSTPKPTIALEYAFARKVNGSSGMKEIAHIWELGKPCLTYPHTHIYLFHKNWI